VSKPSQATVLESSQLTRRTDVRPCDDVSLIHSQSLTHSLTHTLPHSLTVTYSHFLTHSLIVNDLLVTDLQIVTHFHSLTHSLTHSRTHARTHSETNQ